MSVCTRRPTPERLDFPRMGCCPCLCGQEVTAELKAEPVPEDETCEGSA